MIKTMCLVCFRFAQCWFIVVKLDYVITGMKKQFQHFSIDRNLGSINRKSSLNIFSAKFQLNPILFKMFWIFQFALSIKDKP